MRPIDADALMPLFIKKANTMKERHGVKLGDEWLLNYNDIKDVIDNAHAIITARTTTEGFPVIDMKPRNTGEWIDYSADEGYVECSICGHLTNCEGNIDELHYCFNCGAEMRKEVDNGTDM